MSNLKNTSFSTLDSDTNRDNAQIEIKTDKNNYENELSTREVYLNDKDIDVKRNRYPYCIVWTPLPIISWLIPIIGHTGICT